MYFLRSEEGPAVSSLGAGAHTPHFPGSPRITVLGGLPLEKSYCSDWGCLNNPTLGI